LLADVSQPSGRVMIDADDMHRFEPAIKTIDTYSYKTDNKGNILVMDTDNADDILAFMETQGRVNDIAATGIIAYVAYAEKGFEVFETKHPESVSMGVFETPGNAVSLTIDGQILYVADGQSGIQCYDINDQAHPLFIGNVDTPGAARYITVIGEIAYVADGENGVQIIDFIDPTAPMIIGTVDTPGFANSITVTGQIAYVADGEFGVHAIDISDPLAPLIIGSVDTSGYAEFLTVINGFAHVAEKEGGLAIVRLPKEILDKTINISNENSHTELVFTIPSPQVAGNYTIRVFNDSESDEIPGAVTFHEAEIDLPFQKAIILAGGGPYEANTLWEATLNCTNYAYKALLSQGYTKENIRYLNPEQIDVDGDQEIDVDFCATLDNLKMAITEWAADADDVLVFLSDHGGKSEFIINGIVSPPENLKAEQLDNWLDALQEIIPGKVILIYDACQSGSFLPILKAPENKKRIVLTSAETDEKAWFIRDGVLSFSYQFWASVFLKGNLYDAFIDAKNMMQNEQTALIDANGNGIGNEKEDKGFARDISIGRGRIAASEPPHIDYISDEITLNDGSTNAIIWG
jgi:hypothetical protein